MHMAHYTAHDLKEKERSTSLLDCFEGQKENKGERNKGKDGVSRC